MRARSLLLIACVSLLVAGRSLTAHHSFAAEFDANKPFKFTGTITKIEWTNPHAFLYIDVVDEQTNQKTNWAIEMGSPNVLGRNGWTRNTTKIGDVVVVEGSRAKDGSPFGNARSVALASTGQQLFAGSSQGNRP
jgi:uncharacterized protein DUF6152